MGTRAYIVAKTESGKFRGIYNHMDGDPEHLGRLLAYNFKNTEQVQELISLGDIQSLQEKDTFKRILKTGYYPENEWKEINGLMAHLWGSKTYPSTEAKDISEFLKIDTHYLYLFLPEERRWYSKGKKTGFELMKY